jgi:DNA-binding SARP family transcriptional activator/pimeloyl-ACP methyl ester carboxylesterase/predicted ATPase
MAHLKLFVFGSPRLERDGRPIELNLRKALALLVYLAVSGQSYSRDALATLLWSESDAREGRARLRRTLHRLTQAIGDDILYSGSEAIRLHAHADLWLDCAAFRQQATAGLAAAQDAFAPGRLGTLNTAIELYSDDFLAGFTLPDSPDFDEWQFFQRESLRQLLGQVLEQLVQAYRSQQAWDQAIRYARRWLALDTLHEPAHRMLMRMYAWAGQQSAALRQYQECARMLDAELGVTPEDETTELYKAIRTRQLAPPTVIDREAAPPATMELDLSKRYIGEIRLAEGGHGEVYRGRDQLRGIVVAIKWLKAELADRHVDLVARFVREGVVLRRLNHPKIVGILDTFEHDGRYAIVMEYVPGGSLRALLEQFHPLPLDQALAIGLELADALSRAHHLGIIHRDIKPENVLLAADGTPRLTDFGMARLERDDPRLTQSGTMFGSPAYMSPEAVRGEELDARSDIWSLGVLLYELLAGSRPFEGAQITPVLASILEHPIPDLRQYRPDVPPALADLLGRMLTKVRAGRIASMRLVAAELESIRAGNAPGSVLSKQDGQKRVSGALAQLAEIPRHADQLGPYARAVSPPLADGNLHVAARPVHVPEQVQPGTMEGHPFVARQHELERLSALLDGALARHSQVAFVVGEAGQGKTALLLGFAQRAQHMHPDLIIAGGNCNAYTGAGDPYLPFRQILEMLTGDVEACPLVDRLRQDHAERLWNALPAATRTLLDHGPDLLDTFVSGRRLLSRACTHTADGAAWLAELQALIDSKVAKPLNPQQQDLFEQYAKVMQALARRAPLLLVLDDLQWVDLGSVNLLLHLGRRLQGYRVMILGAYRPADVAMGRDGERHPLERVINEFQRDYGQIMLDLSRAEGRPFVDALLDSEPNKIDESFRASLYQQTGGHPLFTLELLRDLQERGEMARDDAGRWTVAPGLDWSSLPARVEGAIGERIGRLDARLRELLQVACVEGEEFTAELVAQVLGADGPQVVRQLSRELDQTHHLVRALGVRQDDGLRLSRYRFQHILIQRYLYSSFDPIERAYLNETLGHALEKLYSGRTEQVAAQLAWHFREAAIPQKAIHYLLEAGRVASRRSAHDEAIGHFHQALALLEGLPNSAARTQQELELQLALGPALVAARGYAVPEVMQAYLRARELIPHAEKSAHLFQILLGLWGFYLVRAELDTARELAEQALSVAQWLQDGALILEGHRALGMILFHLGKFAGAREHLEQSSRLYDPQQHSSQALLFVADPGVSSLAYLARTFWHLGYPEQALQRSDAAVELAQSLGHPFSLAAAHVYAARVHQCRREAHPTREHAEAAITLATEHHFPHYIAMGTILVGWAIAHAGHVAEGIDRMQHGLTAGRHTQIEIARTHFLAMLAEGYAAAGPAEAGQRVLDEALASADRSRELQWTADLRRLKGELLLASAGKAVDGEHEQTGATSEGSFLKAIEIARRQGSRALELRATISLANLWREQGKATQARQQLSEIYGWFTEGFETADVKQAKALLDELGGMIPLDRAAQGVPESLGSNAQPAQPRSAVVSSASPHIKQQIRFSTSPDGVRIAYATVGAGPVLVKAANWLSHLEYDWNSPVWRHWLAKLSRQHTLIRYDRRGCGLSDWDVEDMSLEARVQDLETMVAALKLDRFALLGLSGGGSVATAYAVRHPEKVSHLVLYGCYARGRLKRELTPQQIEEVKTLRQVMQIGWGKSNAAFRQVYTTLFIPDGTPEQIHWFNDLERITTSPEIAVRIAMADWHDDLTDLAPQVAVPTLVLHVREDAVVPFEEGRRLAALIPGARFVPLESKNHILLDCEPAWQRFLDEVHQFLEPR